MDFVYEKLSEFAPVFYEEINREEDGSVNLEKTNIVYNLEGMYELTDNKVRKDIPLSIDIWYLKGDIYDVEDMIYNIDKKLNEVIYRTNDMIFRIERDSNFVVNIPNDSKHIKRKMMNYVVKYYKY